MYINPTFGLFFVTTLASASLSLNTALNTDSNNSFDKDSKKFAVIATILAFSAIFIFSYAKMFFTSYTDDMVDRYLMVLLASILAVTAAMSYISYNEANDSYVFNSTIETNVSEKKTILAAFILALVALSFCVSYAVNHLSETGYFRFIEEFFESDYRPPKEIELQNILNDLEEMTI